MTRPKAQSPNMKSRQLANVLIKILGLSMFASGIPGIISVLLGVMQVRGMSGSGVFIVFLSSLISPAIGIWLILQSRIVAEFLFSGEVE
jgi:hypothetical protein